MIRQRLPQQLCGAALINIVEMAYDNETELEKSKLHKAAGEDYLYHN